MGSMEIDPTYGSVDTEGARIKYWYHCTGPLLILIPGGGSQGLKFMHYLAKSFTVVIYDRRGHVGSKVKKPKPFNVVQQARDVVAIVKDIGREKASVFGSSGGGLIALQLAASYPEIWSTSSSMKRRR